MANDADWVADVRRWYFSGQNVSGQNAGSNSEARGDDDEAVELGYEAAHPALQAHHWPDAPRGSVGDAGLTAPGGTQTQAFG